MFEIKDDRSCNYWCVVYPESAPADFIDIISGLGYSCFISPLHCDDVKDDGELKKPHYHVLFKFSSKKSLSQFKSICSYFSGVPDPEPVKIFRTAARYLIHLDDPDKAPYDACDVITIGELDYSEYLSDLSSYKVREFNISTEIFDYCVQNHVTEFSTLYSHIMSNGLIKWFDWLNSRRNYFMIQGFISSIRYRDNDSVKLSTNNSKERREEV